MTRAFALAALVAVVAAGCGSGNRYHYSSAITSNYMRNCVAGRATRAYCACTLDKLSEHVSTKDFQRMALAGGTLTPKIRRNLIAAVKACRKKL